MTTRSRIALSFTAMLALCLLLTAALAWYEFVHEAEDGDVPDTDRSESMEWRFAEIIGRGAIPVALLGLGGWWLMRRLFRPIEVLTEAAEKVDASHFGQPLPLTGRNDEIDRLTDVFNGMRSRLQRSFSHVREFTLHASHELRTPLTILHASLERELQNPALTEAQRDALVFRLDEVQRMTKIVDSLSLLTKADANMLKLEMGPVQLHELLTDAVEDAGVLGAPLGVTVTLTECQPCEVKGDRHRLRQLLLVLVDNAVKYNHSGGTVGLGLCCADGRASVSVSNTGPGLRPEDQSRVFDRFFRGEASRSQRIEGSGLGLSIADWLTRAHGGTISFKSSADLTTVTVLLPAHCAL